MTESEIKALLKRFPTSYLHGKEISKFTKLDKHCLKNAILHDLNPPKPKAEKPIKIKVVKVKPKKLIKPKVIKVKVIKPPKVNIVKIPKPKAIKAPKPPKVKKVKVPKRITNGNNQHTPLAYKIEVTKDGLTETFDRVFQVMAHYGVIREIVDYGLKVGYSKSKKMTFKKVEL